MYLSRSAEYALRAMASLARSAERDEKVRASDLAPRIGVPLPYLSKILNRLTVAKLLTSQKGHGGGFSLARGPGKIRFIDVLRAVDFSPRSDHCLFGWDQCDTLDPCPLHHEWSGMKESFEAWATTRTLADVLGHGGTHEPGDLLRVLNGVR